MHPITDLSSNRSILMPVEALSKRVVGLIRNAIENTPNGGKVEVTVRNRSTGVELIVRDTGIRNRTRGSATNGLAIA